MTIQLNIPLQSIHTLPSFPKETHIVDFDDEHSDLHPLKSEYTSLKDLIVPSPHGKSGSGRVHDVEWCDLSKVKFKDKLLKQAARAYLQPIVREAAPKNNVFMKCWKSFVMKNKTLIMTIVDYLQKQTENFMKLIRTECFNIVQALKPHYLKFLNVKPNRFN